MKRFLLVCAADGAVELYRKAVEELGANVSHVTTFRKASRLLLNTAHHGLLVDVKTNVKLARQERHVAQQLFGSYPTALLRLEPKSKKLYLLHFGQARGAVSLEEFVRGCGSLAPRILRSSPRIALNFNVALSRRSSNSIQRPERVVTIDVSAGGCFCYSIQPWRVGDRATAIFRELDKSPLIALEARWARAWGKKMWIPGVGFAFVELSPEQEEQLVRLLRAGSDR